MMHEITPALRRTQFSASLVSPALSACDALAELRYEHAISADSTRLLHANVSSGSDEDGHDGF